MTSSIPPHPDRGATDPDRGHLIGALLRLAYQSLISGVLTSLGGTDFADLQAVQMSALRPLWDAPQGVRATDLATAARITKQSMGAIVDQLVLRGYVQRVEDPSDGRAKLVRLTTRGREAGKVLRAAVRRVEADWARRVGADRVAELRETLAALVASLEADAVGRR
jgi:DNA-binding MarR family transcriptional regulator